MQVRRPILDRHFRISLSHIKAAGPAVLKINPVADQPAAQDEKAIGPLGLLGTPGGPSY